MTGGCTGPSFPSHPPTSILPSGGRKLKSLQEGAAYTQVVLLQKAWKLGKSLLRRKSPSEGSFWLESLPVSGVSSQSTSQWPPARASKLSVVSAVAVVSDGEVATPCLAPGSCITRCGDTAPVSRRQIDSSPRNNGQKLAPLRYDDMKTSHQHLTCHN